MHECVSSDKNQEPFVADTLDLAALFHEASRNTKVRRLDETGAARNPCLTGCSRQPAGG